MKTTASLTAVALSTLALLPAVLWANPPENIHHRSDLALLGNAVSSTRLEQNRGGHETTVNNNELNAKLYDNQAMANITGTNTISTGAFTGLSGYATVVQNSGNNVIIQSATILNVRMQ